MDFYADQGLSAYRPWITVDQLRRNSDFNYQPHCLALKFEEHHDSVSVFVLRTDTNQKTIFQCRKLVLAPGVLGTARIVLRSMKMQNRLPLICNHYCYVPCLQLAMLGQPVEQFKTSMAQLALYHDEDGTHTDVAVACLFSYRSLLLFRLLKETPLNFADGRRIMQYLQSCFVIAGIHHPDSGGLSKSVRLIEDTTSITRDRLGADYTLTNEEVLKTDRRERKYLAALRKLRCYPIKRVYPGYGASIHYGGTLPVSVEENAYTMDQDGRLHGTKRIFIADGSGLKYLPAKGLTLSLMANAHRVALKLVQS
jgi:Choline dehydrogenase and related flavoproteins